MEKRSVYNLWFLLLCCFSKVSSTFGAATINDEDGNYDPIEIKIPMNVWQQALRPTPVLKSTATIVLPIHVGGQNDYEEDEVDENEIEDENENEGIEEQTEILNIASVTTPSVADITAVTTAATTATVQQDVQEDEITSDPESDVTGEVVRYPCSCRNGQCGCCTGTFLQAINMRACGNISFVPEDFVFDVRMSVNNRTVIRRRVSASDPPPVCFNPRRAPFVRVCAEISSIRIRNRNAYACLDINADIGGFDVYSASFRCFGLGVSGVQTGLKPKPVSSGPKPVNIFGNRDENANAGGIGSGLISDVTGGIIGGGDNGGGILGGIGSGIFGGGGGNSDSNDDDGGGPFDALGDAFDDIGDFLDTR